jgi:hypothetical protein
MESLGVAHRFTRRKKVAGWEWIYQFLKRHPRITVRKAENLSINRALGMSRSEVGAFFEILERNMIELVLPDKPDRIFNADESGLQMNTRGKHVVCGKSKKNVHSITPKEKGKTVTVLQRLHTEYQGQLPPGSYVFKSDSGYINSEIFLGFLKQFIKDFRVRSDNPAIRSVDGHDSHSRDAEMLQHCVDHGLRLLCLPPHTTHWLQPTDRSFFRPLKVYFYKEGAVFLRSHGRSFTKIELCSIFCKPWMKAATAGNALHGFRASGIWPLNMADILDSA